MIDFSNISAEKILPWVYLVAFAMGSYALFWVFMRFNRVKASVGWQFIDSMGKVKKGQGGFDLVLRIKSQAGRESYQFVKHTPLIEYPYVVKGEKVKKLVIYDERAVDYLNGIPVLNVTPNDIRPIDRETGLLVNIPSEIIEKLSVDSSKTAEQEAMNNKTIKILIWTIVGMAILFILGLAYINQTNSEIQTALMQCTVELGRSATIIAG